MLERYKLVAVIDKKASANSKKPRHVVDKKETAKKLSTVINMKQERRRKLKRDLVKRKLSKLNLDAKEQI